MKLSRKEHKIISLKLKEYINLYYSQRNNITKIGELKDIELYDKHYWNSTVFVFEIIEKKGDREKGGNRFAQSRRIIRKIAGNYLKTFESGAGWPLLIETNNYIMLEEHKGPTIMRIRIHPIFMKVLVHKWVTAEKLNILLNE